MGRLIDICDDCGSQQLGIHRNATVSDACDDRGWIFRRRRHPRFQHILQNLQALHVPSPSAGPDIRLWRRGSKVFSPYFSSKKTWELIINVSSAVPWRKVLWFPLHVPRYAFIVWLAIRDRLSTGARQVLGDFHKPALFVVSLMRLVIIFSTPVCILLLFGHLYAVLS